MIFLVFRKLWLWVFIPFLTIHAKIPKKTEAQNAARRKLPGPDNDSKLQITLTYHLLLILYGNHAPDGFNNNVKHTLMHRFHGATTENQPCQEQKCQT